MAGRIRNLRTAINLTVAPFLVSPPKGVNASDISAQSTRLFNWGVNLQRPRFGARLKWNHVPEPKRVTPTTTPKVL